MATVKVPVSANLDELIAANPPGTRFLLAAGIHRMKQITPKEGNIFTGVYKKGKLASILSGARVLSNWQFERGYWWVGGQTQRGENPVPPNECCIVTDSCCSLPEDLFMDNELKKRVGSLLEVRPGTWFFDYDANRIYVGDNPHGRYVETSVKPYVFNSVPFSNIALEDLIIEKYAAPSATGAVNLGNSAQGASNWEVRRSELRYNHGGAVWNDTNTYTRECYIHHNGGFGLCGAGSDIIIEGNEIAFNNTVDYNPYWGAGGSKWVYTTNLIVRGNYAHHNKGPALWTDINNIYTTYENNLVEDNWMSGIFHEISYDATIRNNTCRRNGLEKAWPWWTSGAGISVVNSRNVEVYGNICEENWQEITGLQDGRNGPGIHGPWVTENLQVRHNRSRNTMGIPGAGRTGCIDCVPVYNHNYYEIRGNSVPFFLTNPNEQLDWAAWQRRGQDPNGTFVSI